MFSRHQEFDGASRRNPGRAAFGFAVMQEGNNHLVRLATAGSKVMMVTAMVMVPQLPGLAAVWLHGL